MRILIEYKCKVCGNKQTRWIIQGKPNPNGCYLGLKHSWTENWRKNQ